MDDWKLKTRPVSGQTQKTEENVLFVGFAVHIQLLYRRVSGPGNRYNVVNTVPNINKKIYL